MGCNGVLQRCCGSLYIAATTVAKSNLTNSQLDSKVSRNSRRDYLRFKSIARSHPDSKVLPNFVVSDEEHGNKQIISLTPRLYQYILSNILKELREETAAMRGSQMQVSPEQAQLLAMLVQIIGAQRCIELGVYTGYSSLAVALVLPESGCIVACDRDERSLEVAKKYYARAGVSHKVAIQSLFSVFFSLRANNFLENQVKVKHGIAAEILRTLILNGEEESYDFAFVDADKRMNHEYYELLLRLVRPGGVIVIDNVLWHGKVSDPLVNDIKTLSIRNFNKRVMEDERVSISMVPIGDGITICRKL